MKNVIISTILLAFCIAGSLLATKAINQKSAELEEFCDEMIQAMDTNDFELAEKAYHKIFDKWQSFRKLLFICMNHSIVDNVELTMYKLEVMIQEKEEVHVKEYTVELKYLFDELSDTELLSFENIL